MVYRGTYKNGVVVLDDKGNLSDGQRVTIEPEGSPLLDAPKPSTTQKLLELSGVIKDGPSDASRNHDHYLYGAARRDSET